ncbi:MAG: 50S ribosomal protein L9 [Candidatus Uhrbacteria bacterium]
MKVLLIQSVSNVGVAGEVRDVSDGYARNHLFPKHLAVPATANALHFLEEQTSEQCRSSERELLKLQAAASHLDGYGLTISAAATAEGKLYGGISATMIVRALHEAGFVVEAGWVVIGQPIREVGTHVVSVKFPHGLEAEVTLIIEPEQ